MHSSERSFEILSPWQWCDAGLETQLRKEIGAFHPLHKVSVQSVARRVDNDDVLFELDNHQSKLCVVHLTWQESPFRGWIWKVYQVVVLVFSITLVAVTLTIGVWLATFLVLLVVAAIGGVTVLGLRHYGQWPSTVFYMDWHDWQNRCMVPDSHEYNDPEQGENAE